jgi:hypothetical protein
MITRRQFLETSALAGTALLNWKASLWAQSAPRRHNLTGAWAGDDGAVYYIRHFEDNSIWWAGLHNSGFHLGMRFANVFRGVVNVGNRTVEGFWADVPRGEILQNGNLSLEIVEIAMDERRGDPPPPGVPRGTPQPVRIELRQKPERTTGGFAGKVWRPWFSQDPFDINYRFNHVRRYDKQSIEDNTPFKDFAVVRAKIAEDPGVLNWSRRERDYCTFINGDHDDDGDLTFSLKDPVFDPEFWRTGWINSPEWIDSSTLIKRHLERNYNKFHCEVAMFGRTNNEDDCGKTPNVLLPAWMETEGDSVSLNGRPVNGQVVQIRDHSTNPPSLWLEILGKPLKPGREVRITGVVNLDEHEYNPGDDEEDYPYSGTPEIHPVYSIEVIQDFGRPRPSADLTGVWHGNDAGTYYLRQVDGDTVWWLGLSRDQGRSFANVFQGRIEGTSVIGEWVDIPAGVRGARSSGRLKLGGDPDNPVRRSWGLAAYERTGGFGGSSWRKLYDWPDPLFTS